MKQSVFITVVMIIATAISVAIYVYLLPDFIREGGPLVVALLVLTLMVTTFIVERLFSLRKARGKAELTTFLRKVQQFINARNIDGAIKSCDEQRGSMANIIRTGLERYKHLTAEGEPRAAKDVMVDVQQAIEEAMMLEVPLLERNLIALSTIASIATMVGLLGTVIGMIRAFRALAHAGAVDAIQLSVGISEALINTAGGLIAAIAGIVAYNYFTTRVDNFTYMIDEASYSIIQSLALKRDRKP